jgi:hypothetical protein
VVNQAAAEKLDYPDYMINLNFLNNSQYGILCSDRERSMRRDLGHFSLLSPTGASLRVGA